MGRKLKHAQIADLHVGQSVSLPIESVGNLPTFRASMHALGVRKGVKYAVHDEGENVIVTRQAQTEQEFAEFVTRLYSQPYERENPERASRIKKAMFAYAAELLLTLD